MSQTESLFLGFDLSTQQLKCLAVDARLMLRNSATVDFDQDFGFKYGLSKGVMSDGKEGEVHAPVAMWLEAVDLVLQRLKCNGMDFGAVESLSGAGMQHGTVFWNHRATETLRNLNASSSLVEQLGPDPLMDRKGADGGGAFAFLRSPNWQDSSTSEQCKSFNDFFKGDEQQLADVTGSKAHHRFSGPQIMRFREKHPLAYNNTARISLVSSFITTVFLGCFAPIDISDVCGTNLWDIREGCWHRGLCELAAGPGCGEELERKLGKVLEDGGGSLGTISEYFVRRYGFRHDCKIAPATGDNPSTILALTLRASDAIVSLGTSTTYLMSTPKYRPDPSYHFMNHPTTAGLYMFMLCYKNGALARERIRDALNSQLHSSNINLDNKEQGLWAMYNEVVTSTAPLGCSDTSKRMKMGLYFPRHEIVPNIPAGEWRFLYNQSEDFLTNCESRAPWNIPHDDARAIVESQLLSIRLRASNMMDIADENSSNKLLLQPRRIYLVGGGSINPSIAQLVGEVLGGSEGVYRLDIGGNACALGAAYKAVWASRRTVYGVEMDNVDIRGGRDTESFENFIAKHWAEDDFIKKVDVGYRAGVFETYGRALRGFARMEQAVVREIEIRQSNECRQWRRASLEMGTTLTRERDLGMGVG